MRDPTSIELGDIVLYRLTESEVTHELVHDFLAAQPVCAAVVTRIDPDDPGVVLLRVFLPGSGGRALEALADHDPEPYSAAASPGTWRWRNRDAC